MEWVFAVIGRTYCPPSSSKKSLCKDTPVFATSKDVIKFIGKYNTTDEIKNDMMAVRWHVFNFT